MRMNRSIHAYQLNDSYVSLCRFISISFKPRTDILVKESARGWHAVCKSFKVIRYQSFCFNVSTGFCEAACIVCHAIETKVIINVITTDMSMAIHGKAIV